MPSDLETAPPSDWPLLVAVADPAFACTADSRLLSVAAVQCAPASLSKAILHWSTGGGYTLRRPVERPVFGGLRVGSHIRWLADQPLERVGRSTPRHSARHWQ